MVWLRRVWTRGERREGGLSEEKGHIMKTNGGLTPFGLEYDAATTGSLGSNPPGQQTNVMLIALAIRCWPVGAGARWIRPARTLYATIDVGVN